MKQAVQHIPGEVQGKKKTRPECGSAFSVWVEAAFSKLRAAMTGRGKKTKTKNCCCCTASREKSRLIMITVPVAEFVF